MDFFARLVERTLGRAPLAQVHVVSRFSPEPPGAGGAVAGAWQEAGAENVWEDSPGPLEQETFTELPWLSRPLPVSGETLPPHASLTPRGAMPAAGDRLADHPQVEPIVQTAESARPPAAPDGGPPRRQGEPEGIDEPRPPAPAISQALRPVEAAVSPAAPAYVSKRASTEAGHPVSARFSPSRASQQELATAAQAESEPASKTAPARARRPASAGLEPAYRPVEEHPAGARAVPLVFGPGTPRRAPAAARRAAPPCCCRDLI